MVKFTVDTHLFRELGDLLVGRDSTALVELIKNSYDADATYAIVYGESLDDPSQGYIQVTDDGIGMTRLEFENGFLRVASRQKEEGTRRSRVYGRRYTGSKGIGRLAAHKLAHRIEIESLASARHNTTKGESVRASIDWDLVEREQTLDDLEGTQAIIVEAEDIALCSSTGTTVTLRRPRREWTKSELGRFLLEVQTFNPPDVLVHLTDATAGCSQLFAEPKVRDNSPSDPGFSVELAGDFAPIEDWWQAVANSASWLIEMDAQPSGVNYAIVPIGTASSGNPDRQVRRFETQHPSVDTGPFFQARILMRSGQQPGKTMIRSWADRASGVRVFVEGFRILPYGEPRNDWLGLDADYTRRAGQFASLRDPFLSEQLASELADQEDNRLGLTTLPNKAYFGAVFITQNGAENLELLINREGFVPTAAYDNLTMLVRRGIDLAVRVRAAATLPEREARRQERQTSSTDQEPETSGRGSRAEKIKLALDSARRHATEAKQLVSEGEVEAAVDHVSRALSEVSQISELQEEQISAQAMISIAASVGIQMASFVHEMNSLLSIAESVSLALERIRDRRDMPTEAKRELSRLSSAIGELRRSLERHASYLVDIVTPDARRRRSQQHISERFDSGAKLVAHSAARSLTQIVNEIPDDLRSPPMFPAELTTIFSNLLTNAVKAAGAGGFIRATGFEEPDGSVTVTVENTGVAVDLEEGERWFLPFESTTADVDPILGQGMGLGLTITRGILDEYGADIRFVEPTPEFATALRIHFPPS